MSHKLPSQSFPTRQSPSSRKSASRTAQAGPTIAETVSQIPETFKKRRTTLWAVGVAIIVGAGSILGAQLKETQQAQARAVVQEKRIAESSLLSVPDRSSPSIVPQPTAEKQESQKPQAQAPTVGESGRGASYTQRRITYLEDRRGVLMKERFELEKKLERVREKKRRQEEVERHRKVGISGER